MKKHISTLDRVIDTMEVRLSAFALLNVASGYRLCFNGSSAPVIHFALTGHGVFEFPDGSALPVSAGDIVVLPPGCRKTIRVDDGPAIDVRSGDQCEMDNDGLVRVDAGQGRPVLTILCGSVAAGVLGCYGLFDRLGSPLRENLQGSPFAVAAFAMLRDEMEKPAFATHALAGALMKACVALVIRQRLEDLLAAYDFTHGFANQRLRRAVLHVLERPGTKHDMASLAAVAGMSRTVFARAFKTGFGISPMAFVMKTRLHHAAELLASTDLPVKMIAASIGLSRSHFSRAFRTIYGDDPVSFRADRTPRPEDRGSDPASASASASRAEA